MSDIHVAKRAVITTLNGKKVYVYRGDTVREGHELLHRNPDAFRPLTVDFDVPAPKGARIKRDED